MTRETCSIPPRPLNRIELALQAVAGLLGGSLTRLLEVDKGFDARHLLTVNVRLAGALYVYPANRSRFFDRWQY